MIRFPQLSASSETSPSPLFKQGRGWQRQFLGALLFAFGGALAIPLPCAIGAELPKGWVPVLELISDPYFRGAVSSDAKHPQALTKLPDVIQHGPERQQVAAKALVEMLKQKTIAEAARNGMTPTEKKRAENMLALLGRAFVGDKTAEDELQKELLPTPDNIKKLNKSIAERVQVVDEVETQRAKRIELWRKKIVPPLDHFTGPKTEEPLLEVKTGFWAGEVWLSFKNVSKKALHNATMGVRVTEDGMKLPERMYFAAEWPAGETLVAQPFYYKRDKLPQDRTDGTRTAVRLELWSNEARVDQREGALVAGYEIRDPFALSILREGQSFTYRDDETQIAFTIVKVVKQNEQYGVEVAVKVEPGDGKPSVATYRGLWTPDRSNDPRFSPGDLRVTFFPMVMRPGGRRLSLSTDYSKLIDLTWHQGQASLTGPVLNVDLTPNSN